MTYLLDINVLVALFDSAHVHHEPAHRWFASIGNPSWATCPITESGFVRVVSNPAYPTVSASPGEATERLRVLCGQPGHEFWPDVVSLTDTTLFDVSQLSGHQQITDLYLAGLTLRQSGKLATSRILCSIATRSGSFVAICCRASARYADVPESRDVMVSS